MSAPLRRILFWLAAFVAFWAGVWVSGTIAAALTWGACDR